jgi:hypothetical protein
MNIKNFPKNDQNFINKNFLSKNNKLIQQNSKSSDSMKKNYNFSTPTIDINNIPSDNKNTVMENLKNITLPYNINQNLPLITDSSTNQISQKTDEISLTNNNEINNKFNNNNIVNKENYAHKSLIDASSVIDFNKDEIMDDIVANTEYGNIHKRPLSPKYKETAPTNISSRRKLDQINDIIIASIFCHIPNTYEEAINSEDKNNWIEAINDELNNLYSNNIMTFVKNVPKNKNIITTKWVFNTKRDSNNNIYKYKARLVARGFKQKWGIDYELTYSPTLNIDGLKLIFAISAALKWNIFQLDIKAAYLNAPLDKDIYTTIPKGDTRFGRGYWKLNKALYGLKQSGRQWYNTIRKFLIKNEFIQIKSEQCIFKFTKNNITKCIIGLYVDDMVIAGENEYIKQIINKIKSKFKISKCDPIEYILGIEVKKENNSYIISQKNFINNMLYKFNIDNTKKRKTPCTGDNKISENNKPFDKTIYKSAIGSLIYLSKCTRPDIAFAVNKASRKCENPTISDWNKIINILKYINSTKEFKIEYNGKGELVAYTDSDFAGCLEDRKSTSGGIILMGTSPICWLSKKQTSVATSTAEAEYISTSENIKKILWIRNIIKEILNKWITVKIYTDNQASKKIMENGEINTKLKHISVRYHFNRDNIAKKKVKLEYIDTENMLADILTKDSNGPKIQKFTNNIFI